MGLRHFGEKTFEYDGRSVLVLDIDQLRNSVKLFVTSKLVIIATIFNHF